MLGLLACLALMVTCSGCFSRATGPGLPYVKPANSEPVEDPGRIRIMSRMESLETDVQRLTDSVERLQAAGGHEDEISDLQRRVTLIERQLGLEPGRQGVVSDGGRDQGAAPSPEPSGERAKTTSDEEVQRQTSTGSEPGSPQQVEIQKKPIPQDEKAFREAYQLVKADRLKEALPLLEKFVSDHPKSDLMPNALYWLGEALFAQGRYDEAVLQFDLVVERYPGSTKKVSALLKQAQAFERMKELGYARIVLEQLVRDHPHTPQARLARERLKGLPKDEPSGE